MKSIHSKIAHEFSHDLKNSLTIIYLNLDLVKRIFQRENNNKGREYLSVVEKNMEEVLEKLNVFLRKIDSIK